MTFKNQIPRNIVQSSERETVRLLQDLIARVQKIETNGMVPITAVAPRPASSGPSVDKIIAQDVEEVGVTSTAYYGDGVTTAFNLPSRWVIIDDPNELEVSIDGAVQTGFSVGNGVLNFPFAPPYAPSYQDPNIFVKWIPSTLKIAQLVNIEKTTINNMIDSLKAGGALE